MEVLAYAKLNLTLRVVGRRADGYHELQSLVTAVDLADRIALTPARQGIEFVGPAELGPAESNLALRAARALLLGERPGVRIELQKGIPAGAGLGGGSSDAAAVLAGLNELFSLGKSPGELRRLGAGLGADVPFFLGPSPAWIEGIGERITPAEVLLPPVFLILVPPFRCPTPEVYRAFDDLRLPLSPPLSLARNAGFGNDLWPATTSLYPELASLREIVAEVTSGPVTMTGSGSALFTSFSSRAAAEAGSEKLRSRVTGELAVASPMPWGYRIQR